MLLEFVPKKLYLRHRGHDNQGLAVADTYIFFKICMHAIIIDRAFQKIQSVSAAWADIPTYKILALNELMKFFFSQIHSSSFFH